MDSDFIMIGDNGFCKSFIISDFKTDYFSSGDFFKVLHLNIRSHRKNWDEHNIILGSVLKNIDCLILTEIGISQLPTKLFNILNFENFWLVRTHNKHGVIVAFVHSKYKAKTSERTFSINFSFESSCLEICTFQRNC